MTADGEQASPWRFLIGYLIVGLAWGFTTPFLRRAALSAPASTLPSNASRIARLVESVSSILRRPAYFIPLLLNLSGSLWFFLLVGQSELSLTVPITNSLAFLATVLGEWYVEGRKVEGRTWIGMGCVVTGIAVCVMAKT